MILIYLGYLKDKLLREELIKIKEKKYIFSNGSHEHMQKCNKTIGY